MDISAITHDYRLEHDYYKVESYLNEFKGQSQRQKLMDDLSDFLYFSKASWALKRGLKFSPEVSLVTVTTPEGEIVSLGGTVPGDLFLDNYGVMIALQFRTPVSGNQASQNVTDTANATRAIAMWDNGSNTAGGFFVTQGTVEGTQIQLGSSTTAPTRADHAINTAFGTAPESALFNCGPGSYGGGTTTMSGSITSGGSGTVNETILAQVGRLYGSNTAITVAICHDLVTASPFTAGHSLTDQYSITD